MRRWGRRPLANTDTPVGRTPGSKGPTWFPSGQSPGCIHRVGLLWGSADRTRPQPGSWGMGSGPGAGISAPFLAQPDEESGIQASGPMSPLQWGSPVPLLEGPSSPYPTLASLPPFPQAPFLEASTNPIPHTPLNPRTGQLRRKPNTPKPRALKIWCKEV